MFWGHFMGAQEEVKATRVNKINDSLLEINEEGLFFNGSNSFLLTGEFPYYRLDPSKWDHRLDAVKKLGFNILTFSIPSVSSARTDEDHGNRRDPIFAKAPSDVICAVLSQ